MGELGCLFCELWGGANEEIPDLLKPRPQYQWSTLYRSWGGGTEVHTTALSR